MKSAPKSNLLDYDKIYTTLTTFIILAFLYIVINFFLPLASFMIALLVGLGICTLLLYYLTQQKVLLFTSLISTSLALISCTITFFL